MTDNEIIKALECCSSFDCEHCDYEKDTDNSYLKCNDDLMKDALDLINRQRAENEKKDRAFEELIEVARLWKEKYNNTKAEIERLNKRNKTLVSTIENTFLVKAGIDIDPLAEIKAEAVKEFAERLKQRLERKYTSYGREYVLRHLRELVKEMVGEQE